MLDSFWYIACRADELASKKPIGVTILQQPLVLFRAADGSVAALEDRCAHRHAPLSQGRIGDSQLECPYGYQLKPGQSVGVRDCPVV